MGQSFYDHHPPHTAEHSHAHGHAHSHAPPRWGYGLFVVGVGALLLLYGLGVVEKVFGVDIAVLLTLVAGFPLLRHALSDLLRGHLSSHLTIAIAAGAALAIGEYFAAAEVMFIVLVGEGLESFTVDRAKKAIAGFVAMQPSIARVRRGGREVEIDPSEVESGEAVLVRAGEKVPVDGTIVEGQSTVDQSMITGEPMPAAKGPGDTIYSGSINEHGLLEVRAERVGEETTLARIARLIREAQERRAPIVRTADQMARYFLPAVVVAAGLIWLVTGEVIRTVAALIVACPCALVLATPAAVAAAIARLAREGVLVKGGEIVESLARVSAVAFDKTGTLTAGRPAVAAVVAGDGYDEERVLCLAAAAESSSEHLLGRAIVDEAERRGLDLPAVDRFRVRPGMGIEASWDGHTVRVGNLLLAREDSEEEPWVTSALASLSQEGQTPVLVMLDRAIVGIVSLRDPVRDDAAESVRLLRELGIGRIAMLTGDEEGTARFIARQVGIEEIHAGLLPEDKVARLREMRTTGAGTLMVGDGLNDAPSLATADVGLAMGRGAADISAEAAQVVFLKDRLLFLPRLIDYARKTIQRIRWSILLFAFGINFGAVALAGFGMLSPAGAAIVHQGASLAVILNCVRLLVEGRAVEEKKRRRIGLPPRLDERLHHLEHRLGRVVRHRLDHLRAGLRARSTSLSRWGGALVVLLWLVTGTTILAPEEIGLVQRFGRLRDAHLEPGLHLRWPWPIETVSRLRPARVRSLEIGFRTDETANETAEEPAESPFAWNTRHRDGRYEQILDESLMLTGDENLVETYAVVHYAVSDPARYLFGVEEPERLVRVTAERTLRWVMASYPLEDILTSRRQTVEERWSARLARALDEYECGLVPVAVYLKDVHPPIDVVPAFREVASALEEKATRINRADGYAKEQIPLARGTARAAQEEAHGYRERRIRHAEGESARFIDRAAAFTASPEVTRFRLYVETIEEVLPDKEKLIGNGKAGRRRFLFVDGDANRARDADDESLLSIVEPLPEEEQP